MAIGMLLTFDFNSTTNGMEATSISGANITFVAGALRGSGSHYMRVNGGTSGTRSGVGHQVFTATKDRYYARVWLRMVTAPNATTTITLLTSVDTVTSAGTEHVAIRLNTSGQLEVFDIDAASVLYTSSALTANTVYRVEWFVSSQEAGGSNQVKFRIDGVEVLSSTNRSYSTDEDCIKLGTNLRGETMTTGEWHFDDVQANDESGTTDNTWVGDTAFVVLRPNAAGDFTEGSSGTGGTGYDDLDESPTPDGDTSYWKLVDPSTSSTDADRIDVNVESFTPSADSIKFVAVGYRVMPDTLSPMSVASRIKGQASGTLSEGSTVSITGSAYVTLDDTATSRRYTLVAYNNPQDSAAWEVADLNQMQIGLRAPDATPDVRVTALWAVVSYTPSAATGGTTSLAKIPSVARVPMVAGRFAAARSWGSSGGSGVGYGNRRRRVICSGGA